MQDNKGLTEAIESGLPVLPVFIFDKSILAQLQNPKDARVDFIYQQIFRLKKELQTLGSDLLVLYGDVEKCWIKIFDAHAIRAVYTNRDYESYAINRDSKIKEICKNRNIDFHTFKDQIIFEKNELLKEDGTPYKVFTSFKNKFLSILQENGDISSSEYLKEYLFNPANLFKTTPTAMPSLSEIGFQDSLIEFPKLSIDESIIRNYDKDRDFPSKKGTSKLGLHLRFGTISIRKLFRIALNWNAFFVSELIWRDFYSMILQAFPYVEFSAFKPPYNNIEWDNNELHFKMWCDGMTGYPMVDAGMRELNETGFMHNRLRMITASFLVKHLAIDWRWGEAYFAEKLLDFDLASNNGGWQWAAGCGTDAAPYFRIFNPQLQQERFDPKFEYIRKWVPEYLLVNYPKPIIDHRFARERCLRVFKDALELGNSN